MCCIPSFHHEMSIRMVLRSSDDESLFDNKPYDFNVQLDKQIAIDGNWVVALTEIELNYIKKGTQDVYVFSDVCAGSFVGKSERPLLRRVQVQKKNIIFESPYYVPVRVNELNQIRVYIKDRNDEDCSFLNKGTCITLHFKRFPFVFQ